MVSLKVTRNQGPIPDLQKKTWRFEAYSKGQEYIAISVNKKRDKRDDGS